MKKINYRYPIDFENLEHPRFVLRKGDITKIKNSVSESEWGKIIADRIIFDADELLTQEVLERVQIGRRILEVSREEIFRILTLSCAYIITENQDYSKRCIKEMLAIANFADWNPSHFLDVAEMNMAISFGYDWLYNVMAEDERTIISEAIVNKGVMPSQSKETGFFEGTNNWTQVCNGGTVAGAIVSDDVELRNKVIERALNALPKVMNISYRTNGSYPEGSSYCLFGTEYNVLTIMGLKSFASTDFGLSDQAKFSNTTKYHTAVVGDSGIAAAFSDDILEYPLSFINLFFAENFDRIDFITEEYKKQFINYMSDRSGSREKNRFMPLSILFIDTLKKLQPNYNIDNLYFSGFDVETPIAVYRRNENNSRLYLLIKGGSPHSSHAHLDGGSFVLEFDGTRFTEDLGKDDYDQLESAGLGMELWDSSQNSRRWDVFKLGMNSHNLLLINNQKHLVDGRAFMSSVSDNQTVMDLSLMYDNRDKIERKFDVLSNDELEIEDCISSAKIDDIITFQLSTKANVKIESNEKIILTINNKEIEVNAIAGKGSWELIAANDLLKDYDTKEPDLKILRYNSKINNSESYKQKFNFKKIR